MITTVFLDNDGVLVDTEKYYFEASRETCARHGYDLTREKYGELFLRSGRGVRAIFGPRGWSNERIEALRAERDARYTELLQTRDIGLPGVLEGLETLHRRFRLCIVTTSPRSWFDIIHGRTGYSRFFADVISEHDTKRHKPDPEPYLAAMDRMGAAPHEGIAVEDSERGCRAAIAAGLACIAVPHALTRGHDFSGAVAVVNGFAEVVSYITRHAGPVQRVAAAPTDVPEPLHEVLQ